MHVSSNVLRRFHKSIESMFVELDGDDAQFVHVVECQQLLHAPAHARQALPLLQAEAGQDAVKNFVRHGGQRHVYTLFPAKQRS
jgi:hypothetical protein